MPAGSLETIAADAGFAALQRAADDAFMLPLLARALGEGFELRLNAVEVLNHKPGRRCTISYRVDNRHGSRRVIGKWYNDLPEARSLNARLTWLSSQMGPSLPGLLGYEDECGLILHEHVSGRELRDLIGSVDTGPFAAAGAWLAALHALPAPPLLHAKTLQRELSKASEWRDYLASETPDLAAPLSGAIDALGALSQRFESRTDVVIHRDFYPANLIWDGASLWGIDFDQLAAGDAGVDLGAFLAQTEKIVLRNGLPLDAARPYEEAFLSAYLAARPEQLPARLEFFKAYTMLKLAAAEVKRRRPGWRELSQRFIERATIEAGT